LLAEIQSLHLPAPAVAAFLVTAVNLVFPIFVIAGFFTRLSALFVAITLAVAVIQDLRTGREPELCLTYLSILICLAIVGGGHFSVDAALWSRTR
jgi:uncharacterized membrane protein YphA (DoxX/SURF4 family)